MAANAVAKASVSTFEEMFRAKSKNLAGLIPRHLTPERVAKIAIAALMRNPTLLTCKPETVWFQVAQAATLGLEVNLLGSAYLVPFRNNKTGGMDCQLIVGYQGLIDLARRSGNIESIEARVVYENDTFEIEHGLEPVLKHIPNLDGNPGEMKLVYAIARLKDGGRQVEVMTRAEVDGLRRRSKAANSGPWVTDYEEMARKTVVRRLVKYLPKSIEMAQAMTLEEAGERGEPTLAGLDIEDDAILADADVVPDEESETDKLKSELRTRKKPANGQDNARTLPKPTPNCPSTTTSTPNASTGNWPVAAWSKSCPTSPGTRRTSPSSGLSSRSRRCSDSRPPPPTLLAGRDPGVPGCGGLFFSHVSTDTGRKGMATTKKPAKRKGTKTDTVIGYKGFDKNLSCRGFQYEVGKTFETGAASLCKSGFHFCENPFMVLDTILRPMAS